MAAVDQFILTLTANGYGNRTSSYEYTVRKRGGQGIANINLSSSKNNAVVASFPVENEDQLVLVTDNGQMIRTTIDEIRIAGRSTRGVIVFRVSDGEQVVSISKLNEDSDTSDAFTNEEQSFPVSGTSKEPIEIGETNG